MTKVFSLFTQAGGQGKTTNCLNLGYHLAEAGHRVLLVDLDAQENLTSFAEKQATKPNSRKATSLYKAMMEGQNLPIWTDFHGMDIVPSDDELYELDLAIGMSAIKHPALLLRTALSKISKEYDFILLDCPPSLGMASVNALIASTHVIIPIETAQKGLLGLRKLFRTVERAETKAGIRIKYGGVIPTHYDKRNKISPKFLEAIRTLEPRMPIYPAVPSRVDFDYAWSKCLPVALFNPSSDVVPIFQEIAQGLGEL